MRHPHRTTVSAHASGVLVVALFVHLLAPAPVAAAAVAEPPEPPESPSTTARLLDILAVDAAMGMANHHWSPGFGDNVIEFETEGLQAWWVEASLRVGVQPVLTLRMDRPFHDTPEQQAMLQAAVDDQSGFEEFAGLLDLMPITRRHLHDTGGWAGVWRSLLSVRVTYKRRLFFGETATAEDFAYFPMDAFVTSEGGQGVAYGYEDFAAGQALTFRTLFRDLHVLAPLRRHETASGRINVLHAGYFRSRWEKPSEYVYATLEGDPIIQDTRLDASGIALAFESNLHDRGWGWRVGADWALLDNTLTTPLSNEAYLEQDESIDYLSFLADLRYTAAWDVGPASLWATAGARGQSRHWDVWKAVRGSNGEVIDSDPVRKLDRDILYQFYAVAGLRL
jgi:hypothetical protein